MNTNTFAHITLVVHTALSKKLLEHLLHIGIDQLYSTYGRSVLLNDSRSLFSFMSSSDILNEPVEIFYFFLPLDCEQIVMKSIIESCQLTMPGRGSIFSKHVDLEIAEAQRLVCNLIKDNIALENPEKEPPLFGNLTEIHCTMSKGLVDDVSRLLLHLGIVPTISNAAGTGLREKLGILRITIPKEKELISVVVGNQEANSIMGQMILAGKLDRPGRGFIWQSSVSKGLINFKTSHKSIGQAASPEQIIAAIDSLKGTLSWRQAGSPVAGTTKRNYFSGYEYIFQVSEGQSLAVAKKMLEFSITGSTVQTLKTIIANKSEENIVVPEEIIRVVVSRKQGELLEKYFDSNWHEEEAFKDARIYKQFVSRAFSYKSPAI